MDYSNRDRTPANSEDAVERLLRKERAAPTSLELDRIKLQAIRQAERPRPSLYARKKGMLMRSRLALTLVVATGFAFSTTGATLAITGSSGSGNAAQSQYQDVLPADVEGGETDAVNGGNQPTLLGGDREGASPQASAPEQIAVTSDSGSLPFTGFLAIPLLLIGIGLMSLGAILHRKAGRREYDAPGK